MGQVLMTLNKMPEARKYLEMAVKSDPLNEAAHYRLSTVYRRLQMPDDAEREGHLFNEIKKTKDQVEKLYQQMNVKPKKSPDEIHDSDK
jgi:Tfp pilus assembly protein PilF